MVDFMILGSAAEGRIYYHEEAADRVENKEGIALRNAHELEMMLIDCGAPKLLVLDIAWADTSSSILYETIGRDEAQKMPTIVIRTYETNYMTNTLQNYYNLTGYMPNNSDRSLVLPKVITAFLERDSDDNFQTAIDKIVGEFDKFDQGFYSAVDRRMKEGIQKQRALQV